jgi:hypothetical protein
MQTLPVTSATGSTGNGSFKQLERMTYLHTFTLPDCLQTKYENKTTYHCPVIAVVFISPDE